MKTLEQQFNTRVSAFLGRTGLSPTAFAMRALGDPNLMCQIGRGRSPSLRTADRVLAFISDYDRESGGARDHRPAFPGAGGLRQQRGDRGGAER